jgi:hypothetical protein
MVVTFLNDFHAVLSNSLSWSSNFTSYIDSVIWGSTKNTLSLILASLFKYINPSSILILCLDEMSPSLMCDRSKLFSGLFHGVFIIFFCARISASCLGPFAGCNDVFCTYCPTHTGSNKSLCSQVREQWPLNSHRCSNYIFYIGSFPKTILYFHRSFSCFGVS